MPKALPTEEEILARFHRLRITIGLSATNFGYATMGSPGIIKRLTEGKKLQVKNRERCAYALDELEKGHSIPIQKGAVDREQKENIDNRKEILNTKVGGENGKDARENSRIDVGPIAADCGQITAKAGQIVALRSDMED